MPRFETGTINSKGVDHLTLFVDTSPQHFNQPAIENKLTFNGRSIFLSLWKVCKATWHYTSNTDLLGLMILMERFSFFFFFGGNVEGGEKICSAKNELLIIKSRLAQNRWRWNALHAVLRMLRFWTNNTNIICSQIFYTKINLAIGASLTSCWCWFPPRELGHRLLINRLLWALWLLLPDCILILWLISALAIYPNCRSLTKEYKGLCVY